MFIKGERKSRLKELLRMAGIALSFFAFSLPKHAFAQDALDTAAGAAGLSDTPLPLIIGNIIGVFLSILGVILLVLIIYGGYIWMTAGGSSEKVEKAKKILLNAVIGLIIIVASFAITNFVVSAITGQGIFGIGGGTGTGIGAGGVSVEPRSGSLGAGAVRDHFPDRGATDVPRNTKIFITFRDAMDIESFIAGYNVNGTPLDVSDDTVSTALNAENIHIYRTADGETQALATEDVRVSFTDNLKTFVFIPPVLGSATEDVQYTVALSDRIQNAAGTSVLRSGGYEWSFTVGTELDLSPPSVRNVSPQANQLHDRNIVVQIHFTEAVDPTASSGTYDPSNPSGTFENIQITNASGAIVPGTYAISNEYKTITFTSLSPCGTNSCGETIYCLPSNDEITVTVFAATPGVNPPQVDLFPYNGIVDMVGNALDGNGDGTAGDNYGYSFTTSSNVNLTPPAIESISPEILGQNVALDQRVLITFDSIIASDTISADTISLQSNPEHEMWYKFASESLNEAGEAVALRGTDGVKTRASIRHGVFLQSTDELTYLYSVNVAQGLRNAYQNCFSPAQGPDSSGGACGTTTSAPYCCNGTPSSSACSFF